MTKTASLIAALLAAGAAWSQSYPSRPVKVVVPWPPGQATDIAARLVGAKAAGKRSASRWSSTTAPAPAARSARRRGEERAGRLHPARLLQRSDLDFMPSCRRTPYDSLKDFAPVSLIALAPFAGAWFF